MQTLTPPKAAEPPDPAMNRALQGNASTIDASDDRLVIRWLMASAVAVAVAIVIGGITRLTESGLSITEWKPIAGVLPPISAADWNDAYTRYLAIPEAQTVHRGITLSGFKALYWWEWTHRLLARGVGLVLAVPYLVLLLRRRLRPELQLRLANLPLLAGLQGAMGWYMVRSGLAGRTSVSPYRLAAHLAVALVILAIAVWTAVGLARGLREGPQDHAANPSAERRTTALLAALACCTLLSGAFVAGLDAGRMFNTFPLMEGRLIPVGYGALAGWRNAFENPIAVQLHHRILAVLTTLLVWGTAIVAARRHWTHPVRRWLQLSAVAAAIQVSLGIATLLLSVPLVLAVAHQLGAVLLLTTLILAAAEAFGAGGVPDAAPAQGSAV